MARWLATTRCLLLLAGAGSLLGAMAWSAPASAARPETRIVGPYCPPTGCAGLPRSALGTAAGFGATAAAALVLGRRRDVERSR